MQGGSIIEKLTLKERTVGAARYANVAAKPCFVSHSDRFSSLLGPNPTVELKLEEDHPFAHEAGVYFPHDDCLFVTSHRFIPVDSTRATITINRLWREKDGSWNRELVSNGIIMPNGGINHDSGLLLCVQGDREHRGGLMHMMSSSPYRAEYLLDSYHGRRFNSPNDVVVSRDGSLWFTDPIYGFEQGFCPVPELPSHVYRFDPKTGDIRAMADGFGRPNGLAFSPDETILYVTDTDWVHGDGTTDDTRPSSIYAFDVIERSGSRFLANRRLFAMADAGIPDGIKCDTVGNVYSGCGDGLNIWGPDAILLGKIRLPGGIANFCFGRSGELFLLNETKFWVARIGHHVKGALLDGMGIDCNAAA